MLVILHLVELPRRIPFLPVMPAIGTHIAVMLPMDGHSSIPSVVVMAMGIVLHPLHHFLLQHIHAVHHTDHPHPWIPDGL